MSLADAAKATRKDGRLGISWVSTYEKGRTFYCSLGHRQIFFNPMILRHYLAGLQYVMGDLLRWMPRQAQSGKVNPATCMRRTAVLACVSSFQFRRRSIGGTSHDCARPCGYSPFCLLRPWPRSSCPGAPLICSIFGRGRGNTLAARSGHGSTIWTARRGNARQRDQDHGRPGSEGGAGGAEAGEDHDRKHSIDERNQAAFSLFQADSRGKVGGSGVGAGPSG